MALRKRQYGNNNAWITKTSIGATATSTAEQELEEALTSLLDLSRSGSDGRREGGRRVAELRDARRSNARVFSQVLTMQDSLLRLSLSLKQQIELYSGETAVHPPAPEPAQNLSRMHSTQEELVTGSQLLADLVAELAPVTVSDGGNSCLHRVDSCSTQDAAANNCRCNDVDEDLRVRKEFPLCDIGEEELHCGDVKIPAAVGLASSTSSMNGSCGAGGDTDSGESIAESARKSLTLSLALAEKFAHADSSTDEEDADELDELSGSCMVPGATAATSQKVTVNNGTCGTDDQHNSHQHNHQHEHQHEHIASRRIAPHERLVLETQRRKVCEEIVETERKYCSCLWTLIDLIGGALRSAHFVSTKDLCLIFPNTLPRLYDLHAGFLALLEDSACVQQQHHQLPGQCSLAAALQHFIRTRESQLLQLYRSYVSQFSPAMRCVRNCRRRSRKFRDLLLSLQRNPDCEALDLTAFLLTPVQRLPRYLLLVRQLAERTQPGHPDQQHLAQTTARLRCLLEQLNCSIQGALADATADACGGHSDGSGGGDSATPMRRSRPSLPARLMRRPDQDVEEENLAGDESSFSFTSLSEHFLVGEGGRGRGGRRGPQPELPWDSPRHLKRQQQQQLSGGPRCRSVPPVTAGAPPADPAAAAASDDAANAAVYRLSPETARRLRPADRSRSVGDILTVRRRASIGGGATAAAAAAAATASASSSTSLSSASTSSRRRKSSPKATVKETFRKMFLSRRKVSDSRLGNSWNDL